MVFKLLPEVLDWIKIWRLWGSVPPVDADFIIKFLSLSWAVLGVIILYYSLCKAGAGNFSWRNGRRVHLSIWRNKGAFILPSKCIYQWLPFCCYLPTYGVLQRRFATWSFSFFLTAVSLVAFHLDSYLISPNFVFKSFLKVFFKLTHSNCFCLFLCLVSWQ